MGMGGSDSSMSMGMQMTFINSHSTPLYSNSWTPSSTGAYAGTCLFLIVLAVVLRSLLAFRSVLEQKWALKAASRRYVLVRGQQPEAERIETTADAKLGSLVTARGIEEKVKVVDAALSHIPPFRLSTDVPRAALVFVIVGVSYLLMLAVMTMNIGYFFSVLAGTFVGELAFGRFCIASETH